MKLQGSLVALATPFKGGALDLEAYRSLIRFQLAEGTGGLVPMGTTGEAVTMSAEEQFQAVRAAVEVAGGKVPVIGGAGSNSTASTIENVRRVREAGADGALVVTPYYNKPTQDGLVAHYRAIAKAHPGFPIVVYNVPGRTGVDLLPETCLKLCDISEVVGIKDATASMPRMVDVVEKCGTERLALLSGDDFTIAPFMALGGKGERAPGEAQSPPPCPLPGGESHPGQGGPPPDGPFLPGNPASAHLYERGAAREAQRSAARPRNRLKSRPCPTSVPLLACAPQRTRSCGSRVRRTTW
jgi:hypothetical protein